MGLFDKKEDVLDVQLTQHGKYLVSRGKFKPAYYAFFDDDIIYDASYANITDEDQNAIQDRIEQTPRRKAQYVFTSRDKSVRQLIEHIETSDGRYPKVDAYPKVSAPTEENDNSLISILGSSSIGKSNAPAWNINFLRGKFNKAALPESEDANEKQTNIPQIDMVDVEYRTQIKFFSDHDELELASSRIHSDGSYVSVKSDYLLADIKEENVDLENDNFDIEIFRESSTGKLSKLYFVKKPTFIKNDILLDEPEDVVQQIVIDPTYVEYWFSISFDSDISKDIICENKPASDTTGGVFVQESLKCEDEEQATIVRVGVSLEDEEEC